MVHAPAYSCILFEKGATQLYYNDEMDYSHDGVFLDGENLHAFFAELGIPCNTVFSLAYSDQISGAIREIGTEAALKETYTEQILDLRLQALFYKVADILRHKENYASSYYAAFQRLRSEIFCAPWQPWQVEEQCRALHLSSSRFQHLYREFFGRSFVQDVIQSRVALAKYQLQGTDASLENIAARCGYHNTEHFMRQFKKQTGVTPGKYRKGNS